MPASFVFCSAASSEERPTENTIMPSTPCWIASSTFAISFSGLPSELSTIRSTPSSAAAAFAPSTPRS